MEEFREEGFVVLSNSPREKVAGDEKVFAVGLPPAVDRMASVMEV